MTLQLMVLNLLLTLPQIALYARAVSDTVRISRPVWYLVLNLILSALLHTITQHLSGTWFYVAAVFHIFVSVTLPLWFAREKRSVVLICAISYVLLMMAVEIVLMSVWTVFFHQPVARLQTSAHLLITVKLLFLFLMIVVIAPLRRILRRAVKPAADTSWSVPLIILPLGQAIVLDILLYVMANPAERYWHWALLTLGAVVTCVADAAFLISWRHLHRMQLLREQLRLSEHQLESQLGNYQRMQASIAEINYIRHDLNNQLQAAYTLLSSGQTEEARQQLDTLHDLLRGQVGTVYCANLVADAVLLEKAELCRQLGIRLSVEAALPAELPVEGVHLCSVLGNLLDNAVESCRSCPDAWIALEAHLQAGCLMVRCRNCVGEELRRRGIGKQLIPRHGLGLSILRRLAEKYHGEVQAGREGQVFTAVVLLPLTSSGADKSEEEIGAQR